MLRRECVPNLRSEKVTRDDGYLVVTMCWYPRFVRKDRIDEYVRAMAPDPDLFGDFKTTERALGSHNRSFANVRYEERFALSEAGQAHLTRLASSAGTVCLICQCHDGLRCHVDLLLMAARHLGFTEVEVPRFDYPVWTDRLAHDAWRK